MFDLGSAFHLFIENLTREAFFFFFFRFTLLKNFLHNLQCRNTLNHLNITIHNKNNSIRSTTCFRKACCSSTCMLFSMQDLTNGQQNANSKSTSTSVSGSFIFLTIKDKEVYLREKRRLDMIIKNLVYFICLFLLLKQSNRITQSTLFFVVFAISEATALHCFLFLFMLEQSLTSWTILMKSTPKNILKLYLKTELKVRRKRSHKV